MQTHNFIKRIAEHLSYGHIAQMNGVSIQTAEAWGREPESNLNPHGTGKKNPFDSSLRLIGKVHKDDPGLAREIATSYLEYVDVLDGRTAKAIGCVSTLVGQCVKEHADVVIALVNADEIDLDVAEREINELDAAVERLRQWLQGEKAVLRAGGVN